MPELQVLCHHSTGVLAEALRNELKGRGGASNPPLLYMNPKYVVSLELAKRLKELGFSQETDFYWTEFWQEGPRLVHCSFAPPNQSGNVAAPHVGELGEWIPQFYASHKEEQGWRSFGGEKIHSEVDENEANARAKMLIYLAEQKFIDPKSL